MSRQFCFVLIMISATMGCSSLPRSLDFPSCVTDVPIADESEDKESEKKREDKKGSKTLFEWAIGATEDEKKENGCNTWENDKEGTGGEIHKREKNGNGGVKESKKQEENGEKETPIDTDRPDFGAATTTVGKGRAVLETGFTYFEDHRSASHFTAHSYPEALLRVGLFAEWFEFRIGQNFANIKTTPTSGLGLIGNIEPESQEGAQDLYLGVKLALTEQKKLLPETVIIIQSAVPSGAKDLTAGQMLPGVIYLSSWQLIEDRLFLSGLIEADRVVDDSGHFYAQLAQTINVKCAWTHRFRTFVEWVGLYPDSAVDSGVGPQHYIHPGMTIFVTNNIQLDAHISFGLNEHAIDFYGGSGLSLRY